MDDGSIEPLGSSRLRAPLEEASRPRARDSNFNQCSAGWLEIQAAERKWSLPPRRSNVRRPCDRGAAPEGTIPHRTQAVSAHADTPWLVNIANVLVEQRNDHVRRCAYKMDSMIIRDSGLSRNLFVIKYLML